jgi:hypothetical protein
VIGEISRGTCAPMPYLLSRIQLLNTRLCTPPAPAAPIALRISVNVIPSGICPNCVTVALAPSPQVLSEMTKTTTTARKKSVRPTLTASTRSTVV